MMSVLLTFNIFVFPFVFGFDVFAFGVFVYRGFINGFQLMAFFLLTFDVAHSLSPYFIVIHQLDAE